MAERGLPVGSGLREVQVSNGSARPASIKKKRASTVLSFRGFISLLSGFGVGPTEIRRGKTHGWLGWQSLRPQCEPSCRDGTGKAFHGLRAFCYFTVFASGSSPEFDSLAG